MKIHEYQAKEIFKSFGIPVPRGEVVETPEDARRVAAGFGGSGVVVKAQVHAGGRGLGGGVKAVSTPEEAEKAARAILGMTLVTPQTGRGGKVVRKVLVEEKIDIKDELYIGVVIDRTKGIPAMMASREGGQEIENVAAESPEKIAREWVDPAFGFRPFHAYKIGYAIGLDQVETAKVGAFLADLYRVFIEKDCLLAEINPLVYTKKGDFIALDGKMVFDDNGLFRHKEITGLRDLHEEDPLEIEATKHNLSYVKLNGNVGCMVNGAGLAMASMDIIKLAGAEPANFLDVGGGASEEMVKNGFKILISDKNVKAVLINVFGGVLRCDILARGVLDAVSEVKLTVPVVVRLEGTNLEEGRRLLNESGLDFIEARGLKETAQKVTEVLKRIGGLS